MAGAPHCDAAMCQISLTTYYNWSLHVLGASMDSQTDIFFWLGSQVISVLDLGAEWTWFKS